MSPSPRNVYLPRHVIRAAYMAGGGSSAIEISGEIGTTPERVYGLCHRHRIKLIQKGPHQIAITMPIAKSALAEIAKIATKRGADPVWIAARVLEACAAEPALLHNLIDEIDEK